MDQVERRLKLLELTRGAGAAHPKGAAYGWLEIARELEAWVAADEYAKGAATLGLPAKGLQKK